MIETSEARQDRDDEGDAQRREQPALDAGQREQRHEHQDDDGGRIDDARAHLAGRRRRSTSRMPAIAVRAVRRFSPQPAEDVLDIDHGVVDQLADGDGEAAQRHGVDRQPEQLEHDDASISTDSGMAVSEMNVVCQLSRNSEQHERDDDQRLDQHLLHVGDRGLDERRLPELDVGRRARLRASRAAAPAACASICCGDA